MNEWITAARSHVPTFMQIRPRRQLGKRVKYKHFVHLYGTITVLLTTGDKHADNPIIVSLNKAVILIVKQLTMH